MKRVLSFLVVLAVASPSCKSRVTDSRVTNSFGTIQASFFLFHSIQEKFIDEATDAVHDIGEGRKVDVTELKLLLDSSIKANESRLKIVRQAEEADAAIGYRQKVINYLELFNSAFKNEFRQFITVVSCDMTVIEKTDWFSTRLKPKLLKLKEAEIAVLEAKEQMMAKYDLYKVNEMIDAAGGKLDSMYNKK
jgi:hypothetical protein